MLMIFVKTFNFGAKILKLILGNPDICKRSVEKIINFYTPTPLKNFLNTHTTFGLTHLWPRFSHSQILKSFIPKNTYFLRPEKKGALDFKNLKRKKYFNNLIKPNWINSNNSFLINWNLFCSSKYHSFWEIRILKTVNKLYFGQKWEKVGKFCLICLLLQLIYIF